MAKKKILLWTLNRTEELLTEARGDLEAVFKEGFFSPSRARFADRREFSGEGSGSPSSNLMPDVEYFVPIAAKCVGDLFKEPAYGAVLDPIRTYYESNVWHGPYGAYWQEMFVRSRSSTTRMTTPPCTGYYQILARAAEAGYANVLMGYSQGGLVARYLAWLDERLGGKAVAGIVTVGTPNSGSTLANPLNREAVVDGLVRTAAAAVSLRGPAYEEVAAKLADLVAFHDVDDLLAFMAAAVAADGSLKDKTRRDWLALLATARKWLSGLEPRGPGYRATAFTDLDLFDVARPYSVLGSVHGDPLRRVFHAAIVNADGSFENFVRAAVGDVLYWVLSLPLSAIRILDRPIVPDNFRAMGDVYREAAMREAPPPEFPLPDDVLLALRRLEEGAPEYGLPPRAHDFVIPSAYQLIDAAPGSEAAFLGTVVNPQANHVSGQAFDQAAGRRNVRLIRDALRKMKDRGL